ncbi:hypothetical protein BDN70DRAFT_828908 [Pholiota conissans]|uniref:Aip3p/Bud6 N-terminal domain-containing protein n=1 Tax=Pholiota conissans TaxID=109636 RepID=A0A9P5Z9H8_9AGAR|nr:hypothetical protein BDN70DRAFT_828908 [Pholiota conissans]
MTSYYQPAPSGSSSSAYSTSVQQDLPHQQAESKPGDVPNTVHKLLGSTKQLQEVLKLWSTNQATEGDVSDLYVQIGHEFNTMISAFAYHRIDLSNIHDVPSELRIVLERCLAEDQSPEALETFLPQLRGVLFKLLKGLQDHVDEYRAATRRPWAEAQKSH